MHFLCRETKKSWIAPDRLYILGESVTKTTLRKVDLIIHVVVKVVW